MSALAQSPNWTPLPISDRKFGALLFLESVYVLIFLAIAVAFVWAIAAGRVSPYLLVFLPFWIAVLAIVAYYRVGRFWIASKYRFFEEGLSVRVRGRISYLPWSAVTSADMMSRWDRWGQGAIYGTWHVLSLTFDHTCTLRIPLTPFAKERSLGEAIVNRIPVTVERPRVPLEDN